MISSAFLAKFFKLRMMCPFPFGSFSMGAYAKYGSASIFHAPMATPSAKKRLALGFVRRFREKIGYIGRHDFAVGSHALPALRFLGGRFAQRNRARMWPRKPMVTHSSPSSSKR